MDSVDNLPSRVESKRLLLRHWVESDVPALRDAIEKSLDHLRPWMAWIEHEPMSDDERKNLIERWRREWEDGSDTILGIFLDGRPVGSTGLLRVDGQPGTLETGYWIHVDYLRLGFATEATTALIDAAFGIPGIDRVEIHHDKANTASSAVPRRLGFSLFEEAPSEIVAPGQTGIECRWAMSRAEWLSRST